MNNVVAVPSEFRAEGPLPLLRELPPPESFPIEALGQILGPAAAAIQDTVQSPWAICGQAVLAAATLAVQGHADVQLPTGQVKPVSNFFLTIAASGERKSATDSLALGPVRKHEEALAETYRMEYPGFLNDKLAFEAARKKAITANKGNRDAIRNALNSLGPEPQAPLIGMLICSEPSYEGLCRALQLGQPGIGIFSAEGGQFIGGYSMSPENKLACAAGLSGVWDGETITRVRATDGVTQLPGRRVSMHLMVQPGVAGRMLSDPELADQGMLSRCLVTAPDSNAGHRFFREPTRESRAALMAYETHMYELLQRQPPLATGTTNVLEPGILRLSPAASVRWTAFADMIERQIGPRGKLESVAGLANKAPEHAARLAAVLTLVSDLSANEITEESMANGIILMQHYLSEALRLFQGAKVDRDLQLATMLLDWLRAHGISQISLPEIYQSGPNPIRDSRTALRIVGLLENHRWLIRLPKNTVVAGERRRLAWQIIPEDRS